MAHQQQQVYFSLLAAKYPEYFNSTKVAEIGSLNINGSVRTLFSNCLYTGYDLQLGPGVDVATQGQLVSEPTNHFDTSISAECFEHNPFWVETFSNMLRMTRPGGLVTFSCASTGRQEHGTSRTLASDSPFTSAKGWDYYRNLDANDFRQTIHMSGWFDAYHFMYCAQTFDLYFFGLKKNEPIIFDLDRFINNTQQIESEIVHLTNTVRLGRWTQTYGWENRLM